MRSRSSTNTRNPGSMILAALKWCSRILVRSDVTKLSENDQLAFIQKRLPGGIKYGKDKETEAVRSRIAAAIPVERMARSVE